MSMMKVQNSRMSHDHSWLQLLQTLPWEPASTSWWLRMPTKMEPFDIFSSQVGQLASAVLVGQWWSSVCLSIRPSIKMPHGLLTMEAANTAIWQFHLVCENGDNFDFTRRDRSSDLPSGQGKFEFILTGSLCICLSLCLCVSACCLCFICIYVFLSLFSLL